MWGLFAFLVAFGIFANSDIKIKQETGKLDIYCPQPNMMVYSKLPTINLKAGDIIQNVPHTYSFPAVGPHQGQTESHYDTWVWHNPDEETIKMYELEGWEDLK